MSIFSKLFRSRDKPKASAGTGAFSLPLLNSVSGKRVTPKSAMRLSAVYACVRVLSEAVAALPLHLYQYTEEGSAKATDNPLYTLLHDEPNPEMTSFVFRETLMSHLLLWGNAYAQIIRNGRDEVISLYPLMPDRVGVYRDANRNIYYEYALTPDDPPIRKDKGFIVRLSIRDVFHIPGLGYDGLVGYSPISMAANAIGLAAATEEFGGRFFSNGATPSGVLEYPGIVKDPERIRESWNKGFGGANTHKVAILEEGMKYSPISIAPNEAQFLETRKFQLDEIARIFRVPPHMIGDLEKSSFSNIEQQSLEFVKYTLEPWLIRFEQAITKSLLIGEDKKKYFAKFNVDGLLRGDYQSRMNGYATARQNGWMSANDIRELEQLDKIPPEQGGDLYLVNGNMIPINMAGSFAKNKEVDMNEEVLELQKDKK